MPTQDNPNMKLRELDPITFPLATKFYKAARYPSKPVTGDRVWVLEGESGAGFLAAVRFCPKITNKQTQWFLRAMVVTPSKRQQGVGRYLLQQLQPFLQEQPVYCFALEHLANYYQQAGFSLADIAAAPADIKDAYARYTRQGRKIVYMVNKVMQQHV